MTLEELIKAELKYAKNANFNNSNSVGQSNNPNVNFRSCNPGNSATQSRAFNGEVSAKNIAEWENSNKSGSSSQSSAGSGRNSKSDSSGSRAKSFNTDRPSSSILSDSSTIENNKSDNTWIWITIGIVALVGIGSLIYYSKKIREKEDSY